MQYKYAGERSYSCFASGSVLYNKRGATSFPARLSSEIFQRCAELLKSHGNKGPYTIYDPCCGGGYLLTVLGFLHGREIQRVYASDIDTETLELAERNLALLKAPGLEGRILQIKGMIEDYGRESHREALLNAMQLKAMLAKRTEEIAICCYEWDILKDFEADNPARDVDIVITDIPYGDIAHWVGESDSSQAVHDFLNNIYPVLGERAVVALVTPKKTKAGHGLYLRIERFNVGKRQVTILGKIGT
jgi:SAM-dependent methyltransferase